MGETLNLDSMRSEAESYTASRLKVSEITHLWPSITKELNRVPHIWTGRWTLDALYTLSVNERFQVWGFGPSEEFRVILFTQIIDYPAARVLQAFLCFGNKADAAIPIIEATLERFAIENECTLFELIGREGWKRKLKGFKCDAVVLTRVVKRQGVH